MKFPLFLQVLFQIISLSLFSQPIRPVYQGNNMVIVPLGATTAEIAELAAEVTPSARQLDWQRLEFNAFIHFGINSFTGKEWGDGAYDPGLFNPKKLDARQWARVIKEAGMTMAIITAKHHDGFCLWPSEFTKHSVAASPWKKGKGDVVADVAAACREYGLKFGFYLSPWDKHEPSYGDSDHYNEFFRNQLRELLTGYGEVSEVWFDGACGEGANGKRQVYDWNSYYALVRELQPGAVIAVMGPDVRWVGTESGYGRTTEWSVLPGIVQYPDAISAASQQIPVDGGFIPRDLTGEDLGSRNRLSGASTLTWYPAETDVSIRPGWFWKAADDNRVKSPEKLADIYFHSVGMNSVLLLNIPPDKRGLIHENDIRSLQGMRKILNETFRTNLLDHAGISLYHNTIEYTLPAPAAFNVAMLQEDIQVGQRIEKFHFDYLDGMEWKTFAGGTTVGHKRLLRFPEITALRVRLVIAGARAEPAIMNIGLFRGPELKEEVKTVPKFDANIAMATACSEKYTGGGNDAIIDGFRGSYEFMDGRWQGYEGVDFEATIDLGKITPISSVWAGFLQQQGSWIFMPARVDFSVSADGQHFTRVASVKNRLDERNEGTMIRDFSAKTGKREARYIRIHAVNRGVCPSWHAGAGEKAWIFVDEVGAR